MLTLKSQNKIILILILFLYLINNYCALTSSSSSRTKRFVPFQKSSAIGYIVAVAIPIDINDRNVFLSFNFEANYLLPKNTTHQDFIDKWNPLADNYKTGNLTVNPLNRRSTTSSSVYTRNNFYNALMAHLNAANKDGKSCLLRTICEISEESSLATQNGIFGDILNILFLPSTSKGENLSNEYYEAEIIGKEQVGCKKHYGNCAESFLELITSEYYRN